MLNEGDLDERVDRAYEEEDQVSAPRKNQDNDAWRLEGEDIEEF